MGEQVQLNIWLPKHKREKYILIFNKLQEKFDTAMKTLFNDIEGSANEYRSKMAEEYGTAYNYEVVDPSDIYEQIEMESYEFYRAEKLLEYNFHLSLLATMYQIFEQQLRGFIYSELNHPASPVRTEKDFPEFGDNMGKIKKVYQEVDYDVTVTPQWETIETLADLINTYKHGDGRSAKRLYKKNSDWFLKAYYDNKRVMDIELTTNGEIVFDLKKIGFNDYINAIVDFWEEFPEHLTGIVTVDD